MIRRAHLTEPKCLRENGDLPIVTRKERRERSAKSGSLTKSWTGNWSKLFLPATFRK